MVIYSTVSYVDSSAPESKILGCTKFFPISIVDVEM